LRKEVRRETIRGKQLIRVSITFQCPSNYEKSLPSSFKVTRTWLRNSPIPQEASDLESRERQRLLPATLETAKRQLSKFLGRVRFEYVPAIKDRPYFTSILANLQDTLLAMEMTKDDPVLKAVEGLNASMRERAETLRSYFESVTGIQTDLSLPSDPRLLFRALSVATGQSGENQPLAIPLTLRGDGIQAVYVPSLLDFVARNSSHFYIWGFEEPENSVEYNLALDLARDLDALLQARSNPGHHTFTRICSAARRRHSLLPCINAEAETRVAQLHPSSDSRQPPRLTVKCGYLPTPPARYTISPMNVYFAGSIRGGRDDAALYRSIVALLRRFATVLTEHVADDGLTPAGEEGFSDGAIYRRDAGWLEEADAVVAEVTTPSLGVGYEVALAESLGKPVLCLFRPGSGRRLSAMLAGNPRLQCECYERIEDLPPILERFLLDPL
jgi:hypothetical protein